MRQLKWRISSALSGWRSQHGENHRRNGYPAAARRSARQNRS